MGLMYQNQNNQSLNDSFSRALKKNYSRVIISETSQPDKLKKAIQLEPSKLRKPKRK